MTDVSISLPAKHRRGRPRKDGSLQSPKSINTQRLGVVNPTHDVLKNNYTHEVDRNSKHNTLDGIVGSMIYGVVEGSFDAGYLISVRIGNNDTPFRGVVFQPKKLIPITTANDVAPQAKMYQRRESTVPFSDNISQKVDLSPFHASKQAVFRPVLPSVPLSVTPYFCNQPTFTLSEAMMLRSSSLSNMGGKIAVQKTPKVCTNQQSPSVHPSDNAMRAFGVSTSAKGSMFTTPTTCTYAQSKPMCSKFELQRNFMENVHRPNFEIHQGEMICRDNMKTDLHPSDLYYNEMRASDVNFHEVLFTDQSQQVDNVSKSPNPRLDLTSAIRSKNDPQANENRTQTNYLALNEMKNPNLGYHQALVAGNPLLLPPDIMGEPLKFMMEKNKSLHNNKVQHEATSIEAMSSPSGPYKLELNITPQSTMNTRPGDEQTNCIADMDFVLSHVIQPTEHHERHEGDASETKRR